MKSVAQQWQDFERSVIHVDAPQTQRREMKIAFYAGFHAALQEGFKIASPAVSEKAGVRHLNALHTELREFAQDVEAGRV